MTMSRVEVIASVQRRRRWSRAEKERLVAATLEPCLTVSEVSQAVGVHLSVSKRISRRPSSPVSARAPSRLSSRWSKRRFNLKRANRRADKRGKRPVCSEFVAQQADRRVRYWRKAANTAMLSFCQGF